MTSGWQAGIDVGGTNTDVLLLDADAGAFKVAKVPTTPDDQSRGVVGGLAAIVHGTAIATDAVRRVAD